MVRTKTLDYFVFWTAFVLIIACFGIIIAFYPVAEDDWWYFDEIRDMGWWGSVRDRFSWDNSRLCNLIDTYMLIQPHWISKVLFIMSIAFGLYLMTKICDIQAVQWRSFILLSFLFWFGPMWEDSMFSIVYGYNYIVILPIFFGLIYIFLHPSCCPLWVGILLGFLLSVWHESYSVAFMAGAGLCTVFNWKNIDRRCIVLLLTVIIGSLWFALTPAIYIRQSHKGFSWWHLPRLVYCWLYYIYIILWGFGFFLRGRKQMLAPLHMFCVGSGVLLLLVLFSDIARASMPSLLLSCCGIVVLVHDYFSKCRNGVKTLATFVLAILLFASMTSAIYVMFKVNRSIERIYQVHFDPNFTEKYAFAPMYYPWDAPALAHRRPDDYLVTPYERNLNSLARYTKKRVFMVPEELRSYRTGNGVTISDNSDFKLWRGYLVSENLADTAFNGAYIKYGWRIDRGAVFSTVFRADDGNEYVYIVPKRSTIACYLGNPDWVIPYEEN